MEKHITTQKEANDATMALLKGIYYLIKSFQIFSAEELLKEVSQEQLTNAGLKLYHQFLLAKVQLFYFEKTNCLQSLLDADHHMNDLVQIASDERCALNDPNYLQTRCLIKWKLSISHTVAKSRLKSLEEAWRLVRIGLDKYQGEDCFHWLQFQLQDAI